MSPAPDEALCPHFEDHTPCPEGYLQWQAWAEKMGKTHRQQKCAGCGKYAIWIPKGHRTTPPIGEDRDDA